MLDLKMWIGKDSTGTWRILHSHYMKDVSSRFLRGRVIGLRFAVFGHFLCGFLRFRGFWAIFLRFCGFGKTAAVLRFLAIFTCGVRYQVILLAVLRYQYFLFAVLQIKLTFIYDFM